jgi:hypothetical protein
MEADCALADAELRRDHLVSLACRGQRKDLPLAFGK